jgi:hypothetical protein
MGIEKYTITQCSVHVQYIRGLPMNILLCRAGKMIDDVGRAFRWRLAVDVH